MPDLCELCTQVKEILGGKTECEQETCSISIPRKHIEATILGRKVQSDEVLGISLQFESLGADGQALCLGEATLLEGEVNQFLRDLSRRGIRLTAIHNHWLEDQPKLIYVHFQAIMNPVRFAQTLKPTLQRLTT
jgi:hypothetical protein